MGACELVPVAPDAAIVELHDCDVVCEEDDRCVEVDNRADVEDGGSFPWAPVETGIGAVINVVDKIVVEMVTVNVVGACAAFAMLLVDVESTRVVAERVLELVAVR